MSTKTNSDIALTQLKTFVEGRIATAPVSYDRNEVIIDLDARVLSVYKRELFSAWDAAANFVGRVLPFTQEDLSRYIDMLVLTRIDYVNGKRVDVKPTDGVVVPSFLSLILSNVGLAKNTELGIELYPVCHSDLNIDVEFMLEMSRKIRLMSNYGIEYAEGYTRSRDGSYDFMSMSLVSDYVRNAANTAHPVYALLACTLGIHGIETVLSPRINYGSVSHMTSLVRHLAATKG